MYIAENACSLKLFFGEIKSTSLNFCAYWVGFVHHFSCLTSFPTPTPLYHSKSSILYSTQTVPYVAYLGTKKKKEEYGTSLGYVIP